jgi:hypothetical protein
MKPYIACLTTFATVALLACGADRGESEVGSRKDPLSRKAASGDIAPTVDDGTSTGRLPGRNLKELAMLDAPITCAPQRFDLVVAPGRTCADFVGHVGNGTWSSAPIFPDGPPSFRDSHCALTFVPDAPACEPGSPYVFGLSCAEQHSIAFRSAECAADPAKCTVTPTTVDGGTMPFQEEPDCAPPDPDSGIIPMGYVGGCSSCGEVFGNTLYITNPYGSSVPIATSVTKSDGTKQELQFTGVGNASFAVPLSGSYSPGPVAIWR